MEEPAGDATAAGDRPSPGARDGDVLDERYRIEGLLGVGATSAVYRASDDRLGRAVAIKVLRADLATEPAIAERFDREARALAAIHHPAVVAIHDVAAGGRGGHPPYYVMELCPGGSLAERMALAERLSPEELVPIVTAIAGGLAELHARGFVHRDVKPSNILLAADGPRLGDFGLAGDGGRPSDEGGIEGTPAYLAPERLVGAAATPAADVYALGAVVFLGLVGRPHRQPAPIAELAARPMTEAPLVSAARPELGRSFDEALAQALDPRPEARPDAVAFAVSLVTGLGRWTRAGRPGALEAEVAAISATASPGRASGAEPAIEVSATTTEAIPTPAEPTAVGMAPADTIGTPRAVDRGRSARLAGRLILLAAAGIATVLLVGMVAAGLPALADRTASPSGPTTSPSTGPSDSPAVATASPSPTLPSPSPAASASSPIPTPVDALEAVAAAVVDVRRAIDVARGGQDGLRGRDANELEDRAVAIGRSATDGDLDEARHRLTDIRDRIDRLVERGELAARRAGPITEALDGLEAAIELSDATDGDEDDGDDG